MLTFITISILSLTLRYIICVIFYIGFTNLETFLVFFTCLSCHTSYSAVTCWTRISDLPQGSAKTTLIQTCCSKIVRHNVYNTKVQVKKQYGNIRTVSVLSAHPGISTEASPAIWSCHANLNHYSFL